MNVSVRVNFDTYSDIVSSNANSKVDNTYCAGRVRHEWRRCQAGQ